MSPSLGHFSLSFSSLKLVCLFPTTLGDFDFKKTTSHNFTSFLAKLFLKNNYLPVTKSKINTSSGSLLFIQFSHLPAFPGCHAFSSPFDILLIQLGTVSKSSPFRTPIPQKCFTQYFVVEMAHESQRNEMTCPRSYH